MKLAVTALGPESDVMPLKGVLLGALGVVPPAERALRDADVLVRGSGLTTIVRRLGRAGFRLTDIPWSHGYVSCAHASHPDLWLDVHTVLMPIGMGRLTPAYLFAGARPDVDLFGCRVFVPSQARLMVQLLANIVKDRVVRAFDHVPRDVVGLARRLSPEERREVALGSHAVGLHRGMTCALAWVSARAPDPALTALFEVLAPSPEARTAARAEVARLEAADAGGLTARVRARTAADGGWLQLSAAVFTAGSLLSHPLRKAWLLANNRGDDWKLMR